MTPETTPVWLQGPRPSPFPALDSDRSVDVAVIGGGITGVTAAYLLKSAGLTVALLERGRCGDADTGHTTAHLTHVIDTRLTDLVNQVGKDTATAVWDAGRIAIDRIEANIAAEGIDCHFARVPGWLHEPLVGDGAGRGDLRKEAALAQELGFPAAFVDRVDPFGRAGMRVEQQALFHPIEYLDGLLRAINGDGSFVCEHTAAEEIADSPLRVTANGHRVSCGYLIVATHNPLVGTAGIVASTLQQTKIALYTSYAVGGAVRRGVIPHGLYWDTADPYHYLRVESRGEQDYAVFGGGDHKTGQREQTDDCWRALQETLHRVLPDVAVQERWSGQVIETHDGLPLIGEFGAKQFIATGFAGNGMTFGTLGAMMARDAVLGRGNPWQDVFSPTRTTVRGGLWDYVKENADYAYYMVRDRVLARHFKSLRSVRPGEGAVISAEGQKMAVFRDPQGVVRIKSAICTHMGCEVHFNAGEQTWDCPCHGSRFGLDGAVLSGPAESPLSDIE